METRDDESVGSLPIVSSLEFSLQSRIEEAAVGRFRNLDIFFPRSQFAYDLGTLGSTHGVFPPPLNLEILSCMGVVRIEHRDTGTPSRIYELSATRNHGNGPIALDLAIDEVVKHVHDKDGVPSLIVVDVGCDCGF
jgi:hypothetical protein